MTILKLIFIHIKKRLTFFLIVIISLAGCAATPGPYLSCQDIESEAVDCETIHDVAIEVLFQQNERHIRTISALVKPSESEVCNQADKALYDVVFDVVQNEKVKQVTISLGATPNGNLAPCY